MSNDRLSWEEYALELAKAASLRSEDPFVKVGACALNYQNMVVGVGYNGLPSGASLNWENFSREERRPLMIHAEVNCLSLCTKGNVKILAVTLAPCAYCANMISAYGVEKVVYQDDYEQNDPELIKGIFDFNNIELIQIKEEVQDQSDLSQKRKVELPPNDHFTIR